MYPVRRQISPHAVRLRREQTDVERTMWLAVRDRRLGGFKFRRQVTIGPFVVDLLCAEARLIVELDGGQHEELKDAARTRYLEVRGYHVVRFWNNEVVDNLEGVLMALLTALEERVSSRPSPAFAGEEGPARRSRAGGEGLS